MMSRGRRASRFSPAVARGVHAKPHKSQSSRGAWSEIDVEARLPYPSSRGFDGVYERDAARDREHREENKLGEAQRLAAEYFASQGVTPDQLGSIATPPANALGAALRGTENYGAAYSGPDRDAPKPYLDKGVLSEGFLPGEGLARRGGVGEDLAAAGRGKLGFLRYDEPPYPFSGFKPRAYEGGYGKLQLDDYGREGRSRQEARVEVGEYEALVGLSRHDRDLEAYGRESYDPFRASRRGRRREGVDYQGGRKYSEDGKGDDAFSARGRDTILGKRKGKVYEGGAGGGVKDYYSDKKPLYLTTLEAETLRRSKGDVDLSLGEYEYQQGAAALLEHSGSRSLAEPGARKERGPGRLVKSEVYDRRSGLSDPAGSDRDSRGRRGRKPMRGSYVGDYQDDSDARHRRASSYLEDRMGDAVKQGLGKSDYRYGASNPSPMLPRDAVDGNRYKSSYDSAMEIPYDMDRLQSPLDYELGNGSWRGRSSDVGGRGHDFLDRPPRGDKLDFLHNPDSAANFFPSRHGGGPRSGFSKHRGPPDFHDRDSWAPGFRGSKRGRRGGRSWGISHADELFRMHNLKAKKYAGDKPGDEHPEPRYRDFKKHGHKSPLSDDHKDSSSKESDWDAEGGHHPSTDATADSLKLPSPTKIEAAAPAIVETRPGPTLDLNADAEESVQDLPGAEAAERSEAQQKAQGAAIAKPIEVKTGEDDCLQTTEPNGGVSDVEMVSDILESDGPAVEPKHQSGTPATDELETVKPEEANDQSGALVTHTVVETNNPVEADGQAQILGCDQLGKDCPVESNDRVPNLATVRDWDLEKPATTEEENAEEEEKSPEDVTYEKYVKFLREDPKLRENYGEQHNVSGFDCPVCVGSRSSDIKYGDIKSLIEHANSYSGSNEFPFPEHRGFGRVLSRFREEHLPDSVSSVSTQADACELELDVKEDPSTELTRGHIENVELDTPNVISS